MKLVDPFAMVKECKGAALSILVLLATNQQMGGGAVTQEWLERHSGYTDKPVSQALAYLSETGRITRTSAGWVLAGAFPGMDAVRLEGAARPDGAATPAHPSAVGKDFALLESAPDGGVHPNGADLPEQAGEAGWELSDSLTTATAIDPLINSLDFPFAYFLTRFKKCGKLYA